MRYKIERGVVIPPEKEVKADSKYPIEDMQIGDSFFVPALGAKSLRKLRSRVWAAATRRAAHFDIKITARIMPNTGVRVWRVN